MKKMLKLRNSIIAILCFTVICMAVGFSLLSAKLQESTINKPFFDLSFERVYEETAVKGGVVAPVCTSSISRNLKEVSMKCSLNTPHDELSYFVIVKNTGNIDASVTALSENVSFVENVGIDNTPIKITHSDIEGNILKPNEEVTLKVYIKYENSPVQKKYDFTYNLALIGASPKE